MTPNDAIRIFYRPAFEILPERMYSVQATAMLTAIGLQESGFRHRRQMGNGPARGWWQFELEGVAGVLNHRIVGMMAAECCEVLGYRPDACVVHAAIEHNDILATCFARLLLWTYPGALPEQDDYARSWQQYLWCWRPGKPRPEKWATNYQEAWRLL